MKLAIIVGHTKEAQGAQAVKPLSMHEYVYNSIIAELIREKALGTKLSCKVFKKDGLTDEQVGNLVDEWSRDAAPKRCAVELHFNASGAGKARGSEILIDADPATSKVLAYYIYPEVLRAMGRSHMQARGIKRLSEGDRGHRNLKAITIPSVLIEPAFGDNESEAKLLHERKEQYAEAIVKSVIEFMERAA